MSDWKEISGGVTAPSGYRAAGELLQGWNLLDLAADFV